MKLLFLIIVVLLVGCSSNATQNIVSNGTTEIKDIVETEPFQVSGLQGIILLCILKAMTYIL